MVQRLLLSVTILLFLSSYLKETAVPIASSFEVAIAEDKTSPVTVKLQNNSYGADEYEWTFEGGSLIEHIGTSSSGIEIHFYYTNGELRSYFPAKQK